MKNIFKNKKGISEFVLDMFSYLVFIIAIFFFIFLFKVQSATTNHREITQVSQVPSSSITLLNYLRTPVNVNGKDTNIADLIRLWHYEPEKYKLILEKTSVEILNKFEYDYNNPSADNVLVGGFNIVINSKKNEDNSLDYILEFQSTSFGSGYILNEYGGYGGFGKIQAEQFVPISEDASLYVIMFESAKAK